MSEHRAVLSDAAVVSARVISLCDLATCLALSSARFISLLVSAIAARVTAREVEQQVEHTFTAL